MYTCSQCPFSSNFDFSVGIHGKLNHPIYPRKEIFDCLKSSVEKRLCPEWDYETNLKVDLHSHLTAGHDFDKKKFLYEVHENIESIEEKCGNCEFKTFSNFSLFLHECRRNENGNYAADGHLSVCNEREVKLFYCEQCSFKTAIKRNLKTHIFNIHTPHDQINWILCAQCSYQAKTPRYLSRHMKRMHVSNTSRIYLECDQCPYKTYMKECLRSHKLYKHTTDDKVKWLNCAQCSYKAKRTWALNRHIKRKHVSNIAKTCFECDQCEFKTYEKYNLKKHKYRQHTADDEINWFCCEHCSFKTKYKSCHNEHVKSMHKNKNTH